jgi:hypothetical protein
MRFGWLATVIGASALVAACDPEPFTMVVTVRDAELVVYRDGDGAWKPVEPGLTGRARIVVDSGRYSLAWACNTAPTRWYVVHSTLGDEPQAACRFSGAEPLEEIAWLSGTASPLAEVFAANLRTDVNGGMYSLPVPPGYHDVLALSPHVAGSTEPRRVMLEHDVDLRSSRELDLPVTERGLALEETQVRITGSPQYGNTVTVESILYTRNGAQFPLVTNGALAYVVPSSLLVDTDWQVVRASGVYAEGPRCYSSVRVTSAEPLIDIPDPPVPVVERRRFRWSSKLDWRYVWLWLDGGTFVITATREWMEAQDTDEVEIPDFASLPGFTRNFPTVRQNDPAVAWYFRAERGHPSSTFSWCENVTGTSSF